MSCEKELEQLARDLINRGSRWFKGNNINVLQAFIRDEGKCVYCGKELWKVFGIASCGDHLLPKSRYHDLSQRVENLVAACAECNYIKRDYDPSGWEGSLKSEITEQVRLEFIATAKKVIEERREKDNWKNEFEAAKVLFWEAVEKYRRCRESASVAA
jgi:CRISPR/Cas system Type II protein with McrA/HNH and RuvC-like nuclease domain